MAMTYTVELRDSSGELEARGKESTLDAAFINLLPEAKRAGHQAIIVLSRRVRRRSQRLGLPAASGGFTAVDHASFRIERG
jgi:ribosome-dependent ATPase